MKGFANQEKLNPELRSPSSPLAAADVASGTSPAEPLRGSSTVVSPYKLEKGLYLLLYHLQWDIFRDEEVSYSRIE